MNRNLTTGPVFKTLLLFTLPVLFSVLFQQAYTLADSIIAGKFLGESALASINASAEISLLYLSFAIGCNAGCSVIVSQLFGAEKFGKLKTAVYTMFIAAGAIALLLTVIGVFISRPLLLAINTPMAIYDEAAKYMDIYVFGLIFLFLYNIATGVFTALGDSRTPLIFLIISSVGNILLDILFIAVFDMGVPGAGWATFIAQGIACVFSVIVLFRRIRYLPENGESKIFSFSVLREMIGIAVPSTIQQGSVSIGNILVQSVINGFGANVVAGTAAAYRLNTFAVTFLCSILNAATSFIAQNLGAGKLERIKKCRFTGLIMISTLIIPFFISFLFFGPFCIKLLIKDPSQEALDSGVMFLKAVAPFYFMLQFKIINDSYLRGSGTMTLFMADTVIDLVTRVVLSFVLTTVFGFIGIALAWIAGWFLGTVFSEIFYRSGIWKKKWLKPENI